MRKLMFESDGYRLSGSLFVPETARKLGAFLFIHGWTGHQNLDAAEAVSELGYTVMTYDMRGHNESEGRLEDISRAEFVHDSTVAYDYLREKVGEDMPIGVVGSSFGGYTAVMLSAERDVSCLSLRVPANYPDEGYDMPHAAQMTDEMRRWRSRPLRHTASRALAAMHEFAGRVQIIEAEADEVVHGQTPRNYADAVADKSKLTYEVMPGAPHGLDDERLRADYRGRVVRWIQS